MLAFGMAASAGGVNTAYAFELDDVKNAFESIFSVSLSEAEKENLKKIGEFLEKQEIKSPEEYMQLLLSEGETFIEGSFNTFMEEYKAKKEMVVDAFYAAKDNGEGITGVNPNVELYSAKVLDASNSAPISRVVEGIEWSDGRVSSTG